MNNPVRGQHHRPAQLVRLPREVANLPTGFFDQQNSRSGVPGFKSKFPKPVETPGSDTRQIERSRAVTPDPMRPQSKIPVIMNVGIRQPLMDRKSGAKKAGSQRIHFRNENSLLVQRRAAAPRRREKLIIKRIVNNSRKKLAPLSQRNRDRKTRVPVREIRRPIQRIDVPAKL